MHEPDEIDQLMERLRSGYAQARQEAAIALATRRDARVVAALLPLIADPDATIRANAASGLGLNRATEATAALLPLLDDPNEIVRERAITALAQIGTDDVVEPIIAKLADPNGWVRNRAAYVLGASGDARAIDPLIELLDSHEAATVGVAAWALGQLQARPAIPPLLKLLRARDPQVRANAAWALGEMADPALISPLIDALRDDVPDVRAKAAWALGTLGSSLNDTRPETPLTRLLEDFSEVHDQAAHVFVAQYAAEALMQLGTESARAAVERWRPLARQRLIPYRVREMTRGLAHPDAPMRDAAVRALVDEGPAVIPQMIAALDHKQARVRQGAARVLGELKAAEAVHKLLMALADEDVGVWSQATAALAKLPAAADALKLALANTQHGRVKLGAAVALWRQERYEPAFHWLLIALRDEDVVVQGSAITSLWSQPDERALATLQTLLTPADTMMNRYVIQALQSIGSPRALGTVQHWLNEVFPQPPDEHTGRP